MSIFSSELEAPVVKPNSLCVNILGNKAPDWLPKKTGWNFVKFSFKLHSSEQCVG